MNRKYIKPLIIKSRKIYLIFIFIFFSQNICVAQLNSAHGTFIKSLSIKSPILGGFIKYSVYLPSDYYSSNNFYPVIYLLHGYSDDETTWIKNGNAQITADKLIANKETVPLIIVMPDAGLTYYVNNANRTVKYEDAFFCDFIPSVEKIYRIKSGKKFRAIGGASMGGYGSLLYSFKHPDMFVACLSFSAAVRNDSLAAEQIRFGRKNYIQCYGQLINESVPENWERNSLLNLSKAIPFEKLKSTKYYIDCGDKDAFIFGNMLLNFTLNERKIEHEFRVRDGIHEWSYWCKSFEDGLKYLRHIF